MFGTILTVHFVHLLPLGGQLDPNNIKKISIKFVCSKCIEGYKVLAASVCCYKNFALKMFIYQHNPICVTLVDCICHWIIILNLYLNLHQPKSGVLSRIWCLLCEFSIP